MSEKQREQLQSEAMLFTSNMENHVYDAMRTIKANGVGITANHHKLEVQVLQYSGNIIWIKWGRYDCPFTDLNPIAMATVADALMDYANKFE